MNVKRSVILTCVVFLAMGCSIVSKRSIAEQSPASVSEKARRDSLIASFSSLGLSGVHPEIKDGEIVMVAENIIPADTIRNFLYSDKLRVADYSFYVDEETNTFQFEEAYGVWGDQYRTFYKTYYISEIIEIGSGNRNVDGSLYFVSDNAFSIRKTIWLVYEITESSLYMMYKYYWRGLCCWHITEYTKVHKKP